MKTAFRPYWYIDTLIYVRFKISVTCNLELGQRMIIRAPSRSCAEPVRGAKCTPVISPFHNETHYISKSGWLPPFVWIDVVFPTIKKSGLGPKDNFCSKFTPLVLLTRVHVYHVCHFKQRSSRKFLPQKKQKYPNFYRLDFPSCNKSVFTWLHEI
jgi:hypothetical protein